MAKKVCVLLAEGFEEIEAVSIIDVLRRAGVETTVVGVSGAWVTGSHGITLRADTSIQTARDVAWDLVVLPGGLPGATRLRDDPWVQALLRWQCDHGRGLAAICAGPIALASAGVLEGHRVTSYPGFRQQLGEVEYVEEPVVRDGAISTSRGPGTALAFALHLVERLIDRETAAELAARMLVETRH